MIKESYYYYSIFLLLAFERTLKWHLESYFFARLRPPQVARESCWPAVWFSTPLHYACNAWCRDVDDRCRVQRVIWTESDQVTRRPVKHIRSTVAGLWRRARDLLSAQLCRPDVVVLLKQPVVRPVVLAQSVIQLVTIRYGRCCFNVRSKADMSQFNLRFVKMAAVRHLGFVKFKFF